MIQYTVATLELYVTLDDHVYLHVKLLHVSRTDYLVYPCYEYLYMNMILESFVQS